MTTLPVTDLQPVVIDLTVQPGPVVLPLKALDPIDLSLTTPAAVSLDLTPPQPVVLEVNPVGIPGPRGPAGTGGDYEHHQTTPASQWFVNHGRIAPREPVVLLDSNPERPVWTDYDVPSPGLTVLTFPVPVTGYAYA